MDLSPFSLPSQSHLEVIKTSKWCSNLFNTIKKKYNKPSWKNRFIKEAESYELSNQSGLHCVPLAIHPTSYMKKQTTTKKHCYLFKTLFEFLFLPV